MDDRHTAEVSHLMILRVRERQAFRREYGPSLLEFMDAEDAYRNSGTVEPFRTAIEVACRHRPDLADQIRRLFGLPDCVGTDDFEG
jgi:hypothetical protein